MSGADATGLVPATSSSWAALLTTGARGERESLFGYLQGLTSSPRVTDEEQRERERLYRRLVKRQRRARLRGPSPPPLPPPGGSDDKEAALGKENESDGLCGTHAVRERKRQRTKPAPGAKERSENETEAWMALGHHGWIDHPQLPRPFNRSWTNTNSSPYASTTSPSPPSFHDPGFYAPSSSSSSSSSSSLPRLPTIAPAFAQMSPLDNATLLVGGHHQPPPSPPHWSSAATTPYLGSYPPYTGGPGSDQEPQPVEASALPRLDSAHHFPPSPYSHLDRNYIHHHHPAQRHQDHHPHHHPAPPPYQTSASTLSISSRPALGSTAAVATSATATLGRDPVACLEWDCALEDPPLDPQVQQPPQQQYHQPRQIHHQQQQQTYYHQYAEPAANASEAAVATNSYATPRFGHRDEATMIMIGSAAICRTSAAPPSMSPTTESLLGGTLALVDDEQGPRLTPGGLADLLLLYPESARHALQARSQRPTMTTTAAAPSSPSPPSMSAAAAALPSLGVSVPSPLFAWFADT